MTSPSTGQTPSVESVNDIQQAALRELGQLSRGLTDEELLNRVQVITRKPRDKIQQALQRISLLGG